MLYDPEKLNRDALFDIFQVMKQIRKVQHLKQKNKFCFLIRDYEKNDDDFRIRIVRNLAEDGHLTLSKFWSWTLSIEPLSYIKIKINDSFDDFYNQVEEKLNPSSKQKIVPKGYANWNDIEMRFLNDHEIKIIHKNEEKKVTYERMDFADGRINKKHDRKPTKAWSLLQFFSIYNGAIDTSRVSLDEKELMKKQKQELSQKLKAYFGIADDPIYFDMNKKAYVTKFKISPSSEYREDFRDNDIFEAT